MRRKCFLLVIGLGLLFGPLAGWSESQPGDAARTFTRVGRQGQGNGGVVLNGQQFMSLLGGGNGDAQTEKAFHQMDANGDGLLDFNEMDDALQPNAANGTPIRTVLSISPSLRNTTGRTAARIVRPPTPTCSSNCGSSQQIRRRSSIIRKDRTKAPSSTCRPAFRPGLPNMTLTTMDKSVYMNGRGPVSPWSGF